jgi:dihydroflavonol-4-reductase
MTIGVTGSAGFLGANVLRRLQAANETGARLVPYYSTRIGNPLTDGLKLSYVHLDVTARREVFDRTRGLDVLFHLAGSVDYSKENRKRTWDINVVGTKNVFDAALANRIGKVIYVSSISVLGTAAADALADESNDPYAGKENPISFRDREQALRAARASANGEYGFLGKVRVPYFDSKLAAYELALEYRRRHGLPVTVVFPGTAVGAGDTGFSITRLVCLVYGGRLRFTLPGGTSFAAVEDISEGIRLAWLRGGDGECYIVTGRTEDNLSYGRFMKRVALVSRREYGRRVPCRFFTVPAALSQVAARAARAVPPGSPLSEGLILSGSVTHRFGHAKATRELGYEPRRTLDSAIGDCIDFYLEYGGESMAGKVDR